MLIRNIRPLAFTLCLLAAPAILHADDASHRAKAEQMLQVTKAAPAMQEQLTNLQTRVNDLAKQQLGQGPLSPKQQTLADDYLKQVNAVVLEEVSWDKIYPQIVGNYADAFTEPELDSIIAFYKTPAGQALLAKTPDAEGKTAAFITGRIKEMQPRLQAVTEKFADSMKAASGEAAPKTSAPAVKPAAPATKAAPAK